MGFPILFSRGGIMDTEEALKQQLLKMGFSDEEVCYYFKLLAAGECSNLERLRMLGDKRKEILDKIHSLEQQVIDMDVMRNEIRNSN